MTTDELRASAEPLTVERLVEVGFVADVIRSGSDRYPDVQCLRFGSLIVYRHEEHNVACWCWEIDGDGPSVFPEPRTDVELRQLLKRLEV